jgi:putative membrane fusion protein
MKIRKIRKGNRKQYTGKIKKGFTIKKKEPVMELKVNENRYNQTKDGKKDPIAKKKKRVIKKRVTKKNVVKKNVNTKNKSEKKNTNTKKNTKTNTKPKNKLNNNVNSKTTNNKRKPRSTKIKNNRLNNNFTFRSKNKKFVFKGVNKQFKIIMGVILALIYIPAIFLWFMGKDVEVDYLKNGTLKEIINTEGIFIRNEEVLVAPVSGKCITNVYLGEKVGKNQEIGRITTDSSEDIESKINNIDNKILKLIKSDSSNTSLYSEDILKIDEKIDEKLKEISLMSIDNNIESSEKIESEIDELIKQKIELVSETNVSGGQQMDTLKNNKKELEDKLNENNTILKATNSGLIAYFIDGYENQYSPDNMYKMSVSNIESVKHITNDTFDFSSFNVESKKPYAKLIKDFESYIVLVLSNKEAKLLSEGDNINITIEDIDESTSANIVKIVNSDEKTKVYLKITSLLSETCTLRKAELELSIQPYSGFKVSNDSLLNFNRNKKTAKIMLIKSNYTELKEVKVVVYDDEYSIIEDIEDNYEDTINLYDKYVVDPNGIKEGEKMDNDN